MAVSKFGDIKKTKRGVKKEKIYVLIKLKTVPSTTCSRLAGPFATATIIRTDGDDA